MLNIHKILLKFYKNPQKIAKVYKKMGMQLGDNCSIFRTASMGSEPYLVRLGNNVKIVDRVSFITHDGAVEVLRKLFNLPNIDLFGTITVGNNVFIGLGSTILPGVKIGNNVVVGAGSIVTSDIPDNSIFAGVPAKFIVSIHDYYDKVKPFFDETKNMTYLKKRNFLINKYIDKSSKQKNI